MRLFSGSSRGSAALSTRLIANERGATVVEFAMIAVPFIALLIATLLTALVSFSQQIIETVAESAARTITTGAAQKAGMSQQQFHDAACKSLPNYLACNKLIMDVQRAPSFAAINLAAPAITYDGSGNPVSSYTLGTAGDVVIVRAMYLWPLPAVGFGINLANGRGSTHLLIGINVAKTEPYT